MQEQVCPTMCLKATQQNLIEKITKFLAKKIENKYHNNLTNKNEILIKAY